MNEPRKFTRAIQILLIVSFLLILWLPCVDSWLHLDRTPRVNENRTFAKQPQFAGVKELKRYLAGTEAYFNDHFGFRKALVAWNNRWKHKWFHEAPFPTVMTGREGWLYLASYRMVEHYTGLSRWTTEDLEAWQKLLEARRDWLAQYGTKYVFVIPPDKHSVYPEHLPEWLKKSDQPSKLDQIVEFMKARSTVHLIDLRTPLIAAKTQTLVYPLTETHWNQFGALIGCREIIKTLSQDLPGLEPVAMDAFERKAMPDEQGDLARLAGQASPETNLFAMAPRLPLVPLQQITGKSRPEKRWPHPDAVITLNPLAKGEALVFRDSFADNMIPFLGYHFNETVYVWRDSWDFEYLDRARPTVVIDEMLERTVNNQNPTNLLRAHLEITRGFHPRAQPN